MTAIRPDPEWMQRFARGETDLMAQIYRENFAAVRRSAGRILAEPGDRDAVVQDVFTDIIASRRIRESYRGGDLTSWLMTIGRNRALNFARRERRTVRLAEDDDVGDLRRDPLADFRPDLERFAANLPEPRRQLMRLRFVEGLTQAEAAAKLGMPRSTAEDWEREIKAGLREKMLGKGPEGGS